MCAQNVSDCAKPAKTFMSSPKTFKERSHMNKTQTDSSRKAQATAGKKRDWLHPARKPPKQPSWELTPPSGMQSPRSCTSSDTQPPRWPMGIIFKTRVVSQKQDLYCFGTRTFHQKTSCSLGHQCCGVSTQLLVCVNSVLSWAYV